MLARLLDQKPRVQFEKFWFPQVVAANGFCEGNLVRARASKPAWKILATAEKFAAVNRKPFRSPTMRQPATPVPDASFINLRGFGRIVSIATGLWVDECQSITSHTVAQVLDGLRCWRSTPYGQVEVIMSAHEKAAVMVELHRF